MPRRYRGGLHVWPAFTDLMSGLALLLLLLGLRESERATRADDERRKLEAEVSKQRLQVQQMKTAIDKLKAELDEEQKKYGIQKKLVEGIQAKLKGKLDVSINPMGNLEISADMLFATNHSDIPEDRRQRAELVGDVLVPLLRDRVAGRAIAMIMVVGHTDQDGDAERNLELSTQRAVSLVTLWRRAHFSDSETLASERCVAAKIVAVGVGESRPKIADENVGHEPGNVCNNLAYEYSGCRANRRIEIRVIPKDERAVEVSGCQ